MTNRARSKSTNKSVAETPEPEGAEPTSATAAASRLQSGEDIIAQLNQAMAWLLDAEETADGAARAECALHAFRCLRTAQHIVPELVSVEMAGAA